MEDFKDLMIDVETLGLSSNSVILELSAVEFNLGKQKTGREFSKKITVKSCLGHGMEIEADTLMWWMSQNDDAKKVFNEMENLDLDDVIFNLEEFIGDNDYNVWGNSNRFDLNILENACNIILGKILWDFRNERDVRTLVSFAPDIKNNMVFEGVKHNSLDDCKHQIKYCNKIWNTLNNNNVGF